MPIIINKTNNATSGFCHEYTVAINRDGGVNPSTLSFGNYGDKNITQIKFDLSDLTYQGQFDLKNYTHVLVVRFSNIINKENGLDYKTYILSYNNKSNLSTFEVPEELTIDDLNYQLIYVLLEKNDTGNITGQQEVFVSRPFSASVSLTDWDSDIDLTHFIIYPDTENALVKPSILLTPSQSHLYLESNTSTLGEKKDKMIKRLVLNEDIDNKLDEGLDERYCIIQTLNSYYVIKMLFNRQRKNICSCFIPADITDAAGTYSYFIVAQSQNGERRWVSNSLQMIVNDNFLSNGDITISIDNDETIYTKDNIKIQTFDDINIEVW